MKKHKGLDDDVVEYLTAEIDEMNDVEYKKDTSFLKNLKLDDELPEDREILKEIMAQINAE